MASSNDETSQYQKVQQQEENVCSIEEDLSTRPPLLTTDCLQHDGQQEVLLNPLLCRMLVALHTLRIGVETRFTALVLVHRFYAAVVKAKKNNNNNDNGYAIDPTNMGWAAAACIFLACKAEEEPRRLRDIINVSHMILQEPPTKTNDMDEVKEQKIVASSADAATSPDQHRINNQSTTTTTTIMTLQVKADPPPLDETYWATKEKIVQTEQIVLRWLGFDVSVSKPHRIVALLAEEGAPWADEWLQQQQQQQQQLVPVAWRRLNDAVFYAPALGHSALALACASMELALEELCCANNSSNSSSSSVVATKTPSSWWTEWGVSDQSIDVAKQHLKDASSSLKGGLV